MKLATLFSGGKDSTYATYLAKKQGHEIACLISIIPENKDSYMFHTPSINQTETQAKHMNMPIIQQKTKGKKEEEIQDLEKAIQKAKKEYSIQGIITGAVESVYQATRIQKICHKLQLECFNPLWQKNQLHLLEELIKNKFEIIIIGIAAYPLEKNWLGKKIDKSFIKEVETLQKKYGFNPAGEGGEYETFVTNCPLFKTPISIEQYKDTGKEHSWRRTLHTK